MIQAPFFLPVFYQTFRAVVEIAGSGSIELDGGTDPATVLEIIQENMKPVLMSILKSEIYEEGDLSYVY
ncbi:MAG: hypothetical protein LIO92_11335 [Clostridiales bacterium]|nr:hypothetical protein [Clostridiales bacterium]